MSLASTPIFSLTEQNDSRVTLKSEEGFVVHIFVLEEEILRVMVLPEGKLCFPQTWAIAPGLEDVPLEGRDRFNLEGFTSPGMVVLQEENELCLTTARVRLTVQLEVSSAVGKSGINGQWHAAASDRSTQSYNFRWWDERVYHYLKREWMKCISGSVNEPEILTVPGKAIA